MTSKKASYEKKIENIRSKIRKFDYEYYVLDQPSVSDREYDLLFSELQRLESENPELITPDSPTQRVSGTPLEKFEKGTHRQPMLSLQNSYGTQDLEDFDKKIKRFLETEEDIEYFCEPKLDGLAMELIYEGGQLTTALTRGDGTIGENVTQNIKTIRSIPLSLKSKSPPELLEARGEIIIYKKDFLEFNEMLQEAGDMTFANPRNAAAGAVRQLDPKITAQRPLRMFFYAVGETSETPYKTHEELENYLHELGLPTIRTLGNKKLFKKCTGIEHVKSYYAYINSIRHELPFDIDGIVVKANKLALQDRLGFIARSPRWATAAKFEPEQGTTVIEDIIVQVGRTGALTPVAIMKPVKVGGVTITHATLHNQDEIDRKDIRIGDYVVVQRAGDVIPEVVSVIIEKRPKHSKPFSIPKTCPVCGEKAHHEEGEVITRCTNMHCGARIKESLKHFAGRRAMNIEKLGDKIIDALVDAGLIEKFSDIYKLTKKDLLTLERQGEKSAQNLMDSIEKSRETTLTRIIFALGIRFVGEQTAKDLADHFRKIEKFLETNDEELLNIEGIGPKLASSITSTLKDTEFRKQVKELVAQLSYSTEKELVSEKLSGKSFLITGTLPIKRDDAKDIIEKNGGKILSSVSKSLDYLVVGDDPGSKLEKANSLGIRTLSWPDLEKLIAD